VRDLRERTNVIQLKKSGRGLMCRLLFAPEQIYVATSQFKRGQYHRRQTQCAEAFRTRRTTEKAWPMEGRPKSRRPSENAARRVARCTRKWTVKRVTKVTKLLRLYVVTMQLFYPRNFHLAPQPLPRRGRCRLAPPLR